jgi:4-diphosphocytidyl-2-C-methyl-D-erythritol kinase
MARDRRLTSRPARLSDKAPAKVNLTLAIVGRRADGYHLLDSLVTFAAIADRLSLTPGRPLSLVVRGATAKQAGPLSDNLVLKAARELAAEIPGLRLGRFSLEKRLPVAAGIGGGSSDAAAALRLLARANRIPPSDRRLHKAAQRVGADVPVCVEPRPKRMCGIGERLSPALAMPKLAAVMVNPGVAVPTRDIFAVLGLKPGQRAGRRRSPPLPRDRSALVAMLARQSNDLEPPAIRLQPVIAEVLEALRREPGCELARMSGSGATCFGLFTSQRTANAAAKRLVRAHRRWWVKATTFG